MAETQYSDAARRASDAYNLHRIGDPYGSIGKWLAIKLQDGSCDGVLYDSKRAAVQHVSDERFYAYVQIGPWPFTPKEATHFLEIHRRAYDKGLRMADPDAASGGRDFIKRATSEDQYNQLRSMFLGDRPPSNIILPNYGRF